MRVRVAYVKKLLYFCEVFFYKNEKVFNFKYYLLV